MKSSLKQENVEERR